VRNKSVVFAQREEAKAVTIELKKTKSVNHFEAQNPLAPWTGAGKAKRKNEGRSRRTSINLKVLVLYSYCTPTALYSYCTPTVLVLYSYSTVLILYSYCTRTVLVPYSCRTPTVLCILIFSHLQEENTGDQIIHCTHTLYSYTVHLLLFSCTVHISTLLYSCTVLILY
jgi:hypothetical protein